MTPIKTSCKQQDHIQGKNTAPLELVEYGDYQCPHCGHAYPIIKNLQRSLGSLI